MPTKRSPDVVSDQERADYVLKFRAFCLEFGREPDIDYARVFVTHEFADQKCNFKEAMSRKATLITIIEGRDPAASALIPVGFEMPPFSGRVGRQE